MAYQQLLLFIHKLLSFKSERHGAKNFSENKEIRGKSFTVWFLPFLLFPLFFFPIFLFPFLFLFEHHYFSPPRLG